MAKKSLTESEVMLAEDCQFSITEITAMGDLTVAEITVYIEYGIMQPQGNNTEEWIFSLQDVQRFQRALRLQRDLELDLTGVALAVELLEEIDALQDKVTQLQKQLLLFTRDEQG